MDKIKKYQKLIKDAVSGYQNTEEKGIAEYESQLIFDDKRGHNLLLDIGWNEHKRIFDCCLHIDLKDGKIWIRQDWTDGIVDYFLENGVPKNDIILAFHPPYKRRYTEFAEA